MTGSGTGDLLDDVIKHFEDIPEEENALPKANDCWPPKRG